MELREVIYYSYIFKSDLIGCMLELDEEDLVGRVNWGIVSREIE